MTKRTKPTIIATISSREFEHDIGRAKRAAENGPVLITDRGEPAFVLMRFDAYHRMVEGVPRIRDLLDQPGIEEIEFEPPRFGGG